MKIDNLKVYDLENCVKASKYPMSVHTDTLTGLVTDTVNRLALSEKGSGHDNFLCGITVSFDLTFTNKAWIEMERYHFMNIVSSQSTMHRIAKFDLNCNYDEHVDKRIIRIMNQLKSEYLENPTDENYLKLLYSNPAGFELTARICTNYRQLKTIYSQRKNHRLPEWREFCSYISRELPYSYWITSEVTNDER